MKILEMYFRVRNVPVPYYAKYPFWLIIWKPIRKFLNVVIIPNIPFANLRIFLYRLIGYKIGNNVFIGMKCYLDDMKPQNIIIEDSVTISYGCYFALHGKNQKHSTIVVQKGAYIGMRANLISGKESLCIGENSIVGAASLVNKSVPANVIVVGIPARIIKQH